MPKYTILIVDDELNVISSLKRSLIDEDYDILSAENGEDGLKLLEKNPVQLIISDEKMPRMSGAEFLSHVKNRYPHTIRIMLTGQASVDAAMRAINEGEIYRFFTKPWDDFELIMTIRTALDKYNLEEENRRLLQTIKEQAIELKLLEKQFPGISQLKRDALGRIMVEDMSEQELANIIAHCERKYNS